MKETSDSQTADGSSRTSAGPVNYFTIVEEHFQRARGTGSFLLSPLDFALAKVWQEVGVPIEAVLRGIDRVFENRRARPGWASEGVNSLAYCSHAVAAEAQALANASPSANRSTKPPFVFEDVREFTARNAAALVGAGYGDLAAALQTLNLEELYLDLEELERQLTSIEERVITRLRAKPSNSMLTEARRALEGELKPYRDRMTADQLAQLEKQFLDRRLLESAGLPRLSLFYL